MTLIELVIASAVGALVAAGAAVLFAQGVHAQTVAVTQDQANLQAQTVTLNLQSSLRNACTATISADGQTLDARVLTNGAWKTEHWTVSGAAAAIDVDTAPRSISGSFGPAGSTVTFGSKVTYDLRLTIGETHTSAAGAVQLQAYSKDAGAGC